MAEGHYAVTVANALGIGQRTWYDWMEWGSDPERAGGIYAQFSHAVTRGETVAEMEAVGQIRAAALDPAEWRAAVEYLKRRHRDRWSERTEHEVTGKDGGPIAVTEVIAHMPDDDD